MKSKYSNLRSTYSNLCSTYSGKSRIISYHLVSSRIISYLSRLVSSRISEPAPYSLVSRSQPPTDKASNFTFSEIRGTKNLEPQKSEKKVSEKSQSLKVSGRSQQSLQSLRSLRTESTKSQKSQDGVKISILVSRISPISEPAPYR